MNAMEVLFLIIVSLPALVLIHRVLRALFRDPVDRKAHRRPVD